MFYKTCKSSFKNKYSILPSVVEYMSLKHGEHKRVLPCIRKFWNALCSSILPQMKHDGWTPGAAMPPFVWQCQEQLSSLCPAAITHSQEIIMCWGIFVLPQSILPFQPVEGRPVRFCFVFSLPPLTGCQMEQLVTIHHQRLPETK